MPDLELRLFGHGVVFVDGKIVPLATRKALGLLAYLSLNGRTARQHLASLFWADMPEAAARNNLRKELFRLRETALEPVLDVSTDAVALNLETDVVKFWQLANQNLESALEYYQAELLQAYTAPTEEFEQWLLQERERLQAAVVRLNAAKAQRLEASGDLRGALAAQMALVHLDSLQEVHHREVMRLHWLLGERSAALERFDTLERILKKELGLKPLPESFALLEQIEKALPSAQIIPTSTPQLRLQRPPLVGRESPWAWLETTNAPLKLVAGELGIGKTRLCEDFLSLRGEFVRLSGFATAKATPFYPIAEHLRWCLDQKRLELHTMDSAWRSELARLVPEFSNEASPFSSSDGKARMLSALTKVFDAGQTLLLDDLHWFDSSSLELIAHLLRHGYIAVATVRELELVENSPALEWLDALERERLVARHRLEPLAEAHAQQLLQTLSGRHAQLFSQRLHSASGGNPLLLLETLYGLFEQGTLTIEPDGTWGSPIDQDTADYAELPIPNNVLELVLGRVRHLGAAVRRILEVATLCAEPFVADDVLTSSALSELEAVAALERCVSAQMLRRDSSSYRFAHDVVRRVLLEELTLERKHLIHRRLATYLQKSAGSPSRIAHHLEQCGQERDAAVFWQKAGLAAREVFAHAEARAFFERALAVQPEAGIAFEIHANLADLALTQSNLDVLEQHAEAMQGYSHALPLEFWVRANLLSVRAKMYRGQHVIALELAQEVLPDSKGELRAETLLLMGTAQIGLGNLENAKQELLAGLVVQKRGAVAAELHSSLKEVYRRLGDTSEAFVHSGRAHGIYKSLGQREQELTELAQMGQLLGAMGRSGEAFSSFHRAAQQARALGLERVLSVALVLLASEQIKAGQYQEAIVPIQEGLELTRGRMQAREAQFNAMLSKAHFRTGQLGTALASGKLALRQSEGTGLQHVIQHLWCAEMEIALGLIDNAKPHLEYAHENSKPQQEQALLLRLLKAEAEVKQAQLLEFEGLDFAQTRLEYQVRAACVFARLHLQQPEMALLYLEQLPKDLPQWLEIRVQTWRAVLGQPVNHKKLLKNAPASLETLDLLQACGLANQTMLETLQNSLAPEWVAAQTRLGWQPKFGLERFWNALTSKV